MGSAFGVIAMTRYIHKSRAEAVHQKVANEIAVEGQWEDRAILPENMVSAFAARCDRLLEDLEAATAAPAVFQPIWPLTALAAGTRNEEWMMFWSQMRRSTR
jgi:hypothetical protein